MEMKMEMEMEEKASWKMVVNRRRITNRPPWDALPSLALFKIFIKLDFKDRCCSIPFVCKAWNSVISGDPLCWSSMIPESVSPDDAFIKNSVDYYSLQVYPPSSYKKFYSYRNGWDDYYPLLVRGGKWDGVSRFRSLLKKASSSSSPTTTTTITSLYLTPFTYSHPYNEESVDHDEILHLIANCCPDLKHISFDGFCHASKGAMFEVFRRCKKLELIDFSESLGGPYGGCADGDLVVQLIQEFGNNLPHLRGIRILNGWMYHDTSFVNAIAKHLPRIKLLDIECNAPVVPILLLSSETQLLQLQYLRLGVYFFETARLAPPVRPTHIPEFHYEDIDYLFERYPNFCQCRPRHRRPASSLSLLCHFCTVTEEYEKGEQEKKDLLSEYYYEHSSHPPVQPQDYYSILKQKKEDEYYVSILKENKKKTRNHHHHRHALMRRRGLMEKKKKNKASSSSSSSLKIMKKKNRDNHMYDYYAEDYMYLVH